MDELNHFKTFQSARKYLDTDLQKKVDSINSVSAPIGGKGIHGRLDDVRFYAKPLNLSEIKALFDNGHN